MEGNLEDLAEHPSVVFDHCIIPSGTFTARGTRSQMRFTFEIHEGNIVVLLLATSAST